MAIKNSLKLRKFYRWGISITAALFSFGALVLPIAFRPDAVPLKVGQVSSTTIVAPNDLSYPSDILTDYAKSNAQKSVPPYYLPADPNISRTQIDNLHLALNYVHSVRADSFSNIEERKNDLLKLPNLNLSDSNATLLLNLSDPQWQTVSQESVTVLEQVLRNSIREYQVNDYQKSIPSYLGYSLTYDESQVVQALVIPYIVPNSLFSEEETTLARENAGNSIAPVSKSYVTNQTIVSRGQIVSEEQFEALEVFGLARTNSKNQDYISALTIVIILSLFLVLYFRQRNLKVLDDLKSLTVILVGFIIFLYGARFLIPNRTIIPYFFPLPAYAIILATLFSLEISVIFAIPLSILSAFGLSNSLELTLFYIFTSIFAAILLGKGRRFTDFITSSIGIGFSGILVILSYHLSIPTSDSIGIITLSAVSLLNGIASASVALLIQYFLAQIMGLATPLHLMDLSRPDHPLQKYLLQNAPGTYQHSLQVSNLAERAAETIKANPLLTRVGTIYHDVGKGANASFYIENQIPGHLNPHDDMDEEEVAKKIIEHVTEGIKLAEKFRLPQRIRDFILEHHGTQITKYPYNKALAKINNDLTLINEAAFRYPGPMPQSKETAILMMADSCEARARAELPKNSEEMRTLVEKVINRCLQEGQLENSPLTLKDLNSIKESFIETLNNTHHPRIVYPESINPVIKS